MESLQESSDRIPTVPPGEKDRMCQECQFETWDGLRLFHRIWPAARPNGKSIVLFHGGHEHSGRFPELVERLGRERVTYFAWDARGHGRSPGPRGYARSLPEVARDADTFFRHLTEVHGLSLSNTVLLGHSVGSVVVIAYVQEYKPPVRGMILGSPALHVRTYVPFDRAVLRLFLRFQPDGFINSYVVARMLTHDPEEIQAREIDPLIARPIAARMLLDILVEGQRLIRQAPEITLPTLILSAGRDCVVQLADQRAFFERLGSAKKEMVVYPGFFHEVFHEKDRHLPIGKAREFIQALLE